MPFIPSIKVLRKWVAGFHDFGGGTYVLGRGFGIKWDGTDQTTKVQDAIDYVEGIGGGSLLLPPDADHPLTIDGTLVFPRTGTVDLRGSGRHSRLVNLAGAGVDTIRLGDDAVNVVSKAEFSKFKIECLNGANGINLNNSRDETVQAGTVSVTMGSRLVTGIGANFTSNYDYTRDSIIIVGADSVARELEIRTKGVRNANLIELARIYPYADVTGAAHTRVRYGNGSRLMNLTDLWLEGPSEATAGSVGIDNSRVNNNRYVNIWIRGFATGFAARALNGRSAGCYMETVMVNRASELSFEFIDCRSFAMKRVRAEGAGAGIVADYKYKFVLCHAFEFDQVSGEDDHGIAGFLFEDCERMRGTVAVGTNFGGGVGIDIVDSSLMNLSGQIATQALRAEDWPTTPDVYAAPIRIDVSSRAGEAQFDVNAENLAYIENGSATFALRTNDWDGTVFRVFRDPRPVAAIQHTFTGAASLNYLHANRTLYADVSAGSFDLTLFNSSADNAGLRVLVIVRSDSATTNICTLRCAGTDYVETGNTSAGMTIATSTALRRGDAIEVECTGQTGNTAATVAFRVIRRFTRRTLGVSTGVATVRMPDGTAATNTGWAVLPGNVMCPTWPAQ